MAFELEKTEDKFTEIGRAFMIPNRMTAGPGADVMVYVTACVFPGSRGMGMLW